MRSKSAGPLSKTLFQERRERSMENLYSDHTGICEHQQAMGISTAEVEGGGGRRERSVILRKTKTRVVNLDTREAEAGGSH